MLKKIVAALGLGAGVVALAPAPAHATLAELFAAVDVSGVSTNVQTLLIAFIGINILFLGYKFVRKSMSRG